MFGVPRAVVEELKKKYVEGTRVKLTYTDDVQAPPVGTLGTVSTVDDIGTIHVHWDRLNKRLIKRRQ